MANDPIDTLLASMTESKTEIDPPVVVPDPTESDADNTVSLVTDIPWLMSQAPDTDSELPDRTKDCTDSELPKLHES